MQENMYLPTEHDNNAPPTIIREQNRWRNDYTIAFTVYLLTLAPCFLGTLLGLSLMQPKGSWFSPPRTEKNPNAFIEALSQWDGPWYVAIARNDFYYEPSRMSSVNFYPAYPYLITCLTWVFPFFSPHLWGLIISHLFLIASLVLFQKYIRLRYPEHSQGISLCAILLLTLYPSAFWFRMVYTESMFLFLVLMFFWAMKKNWGLLEIAIIVGLSTGTRSVGVALSFVFFLYLVKNSKDWNRRLLKIMGYTVLSLWGLLQYVVYQWLVFGEPFAFVKTGEYWNTRPSTPVWEIERLWSLLSFQTVWETFDPFLQFQADRMLPDVPVILNYQTWNAVLFLVALMAIAIGAAKKWITFYEIVLAFLLLMIPYMTIGYMQYMAGHARYVLVIFPVFIVLGIILSKLPKSLTVGILLISAFFQFFFAAQQACGGYFIL